MSEFWSLQKVENLMTIRDIQNPFSPKKIGLISTEDSADRSLSAEVIF